MAKCGAPCQVWSRVCGYYRPAMFGNGKTSFNPGKLEEFKNRKYYKADVTPATRPFHHSPIAEAAD